MLRRTARRERIAIRTFLIPPPCDETDDLTGQVVYAVWINPYHFMPTGRQPRPPNGRVG